MADRFVRVTLEKPFSTPSVSLRYGSEPAQVALEDVGNELTDLTQRRRIPIPGKPVVYTFAMDDPAVMPDYVAMLYFGRWDILKEHMINELPGNNNPENTHAFEKMRVATKWGGYVMEQRDRRQDNHWRHLQKVAPPNIPHVCIVLLDSGQRAIPNSEFRPWERYEWQNDCLASTPLPTSDGGLITVTEAQLDALIEAKFASRQKVSKAS